MEQQHQQQQQQGGSSRTLSGRASPPISPESPTEECTCLPSPSSSSATRELPCTTRWPVWPSETPSSTVSKRNKHASKPNKRPLSYGVFALLLRPRRHRQRLRQRDCRPAVLARSRVPEQLRRLGTLPDAATTAPAPPARASSTPRSPRSERSTSQWYVFRPSPYVCGVFGCVASVTTSRCPCMLSLLMSNTYTHTPSHTHTHTPSHTHHHTHTAEQEPAQPRPR